MLIFLDRLDSWPANAARQAKGVFGTAVSFTEDDFNLLTSAKRQYQEAGYSTEEVRVYLLRLPELDVIWSHVCQGILRLFQLNSNRPREEWRLWLVQVERAGNLAWPKAFNAMSKISATYEGDPVAMINAVIQKFAVLDELLNAMHRAIFESEREVRFSVELEDSLQAAISIARQGSQLTTETLANFRRALRTGRGWALDADQNPRAAEAHSAPLLRRRAAPGSSLGTDPDRELQDGQASVTTGGSSVRGTTLHRYNPTIIALVVMLIAVAAGLTGFAWKSGDNSVGSTEDADFWLLLQSSVLQVAGVIPILFSLLGSGAARLQPRLWSWFFLGVGAVCSLLSPVLYVVVYEEVSGVVSLVGGVAQAIIVLEAMFLVDRAITRDGAKVRTG